MSEPRRRVTGTTSPRCNACSRKRIRKPRESCVRFTRKNATPRNKWRTLKRLARGAKGDKVLVKEYRVDIKKHLVKELAAQIAKLKVERVNTSDAIATYEEFHELFQNVANLTQKIDSMADLDFIIKKFFMNVTVIDQKVTKITPNSPFRELCRSPNSAIVTPSTMVTNFLSQVWELLPIVSSWNSAALAFLKREPTPQTLVVTY